MISQADSDVRQRHHCPLWCLDRNKIALAYEPGSVIWMGDRHEVSSLLLRMLDTSPYRMHLRGRSSSKGGSHSGGA